MRLVILSRQATLYSTRVLVEAAQQRGHEVRVLDTLQFDIRVTRRSPELFYQGEPVGPVDAVVPRIGASITFYGLAVVRQFEMMGVYCLNESQAIARSRDKLPACRFSADTTSACRRPCSRGKRSTSRAASSGWTGRRSW